MMDRGQIENYLKQLDQELGRMNVKGELCLYGGAVMCLLFGARPSTKDVDAVFEPAEKMREAIRRVAGANDLREDWVNDAVKGFLAPHGRNVYLDLPFLKVYVPEPDYLLAMKTLASRVDGTDRQDVQFLIGRLGLKKPAEVFSILEKYYPHQRIKPAAQYFIEELFEK